ncbi:putative sugar transferase EpsL [Pseudoalteromonas sp. P1-9]|nr:putative sugar transferase EpsL [Pseudoalteromonas sp. P1-9]
MMKRTFDFLVALFLFILLSPVLLSLCFAVACFLGRPIVFTQERPGLNGKTFKMYKFRSMTSERDCNGVLLSDEARLTKFGRFLRASSLDELPELINIIKGDMSLVGPRPLLVQYLPLYSEKQARRHEVRPGITGWAQVNGRNAISWYEKFKLDVWYVDNQTFLLDSKILFMTFFKVLKKEGVSEIGQATTTYFNGNDEAISNAIKMLRHKTKEGHSIYQNYLRFGKTFFYAKQLYLNNLSKLNELEVINHSFNTEYQNACKLLINHIESWQSQWNKLKDKQTPRDNDTFIFNSKIPYPKEVEQILGL